jgi:hypothetical protein
MNLSVDYSPTDLSSQGKIIGLTICLILLEVAIIHATEALQESVCGKIVATEHYKHIQQKVLFLFIIT